MNAITHIKSKLFSPLGKTSLLAIAVLTLGMGLAPQAKESVKAVSCDNVTTSPQLNIFPLTFSDPAENCHDFAALDARLTDGQYSQSQSDLDNGLSASVGDEIYVLSYIHNGAANVGVPESQTTAHDVNIKFTVPTDTGSSHTVSTRFGGSNTNTVTDSYTIHTPSDAKLEVVANSGQLFDDSGSQVLDSGFNPASSTYSIGDVKACFEFSVFVRFKVRVVRASVEENDTELDITKEVRNVSESGSFAHSIDADENDTVEYRIKIRNVGNDVARDVIATDTFNSDLDFISGSLDVSQGFSGQLTGSGMSLGDLDEDEQVTITYRATVEASSGTIDNTARARADNADQVEDTAEVNVNEEENDRVVCTPERQSADIDEDVSFRATGGDGDFDWTASGGHPSSGSGSRFTTSFDDEGTHTVRVTSDGFSDTCTVRINEEEEEDRDLDITKEVRNITTGTGFRNSVNASDNDRVEYRITVKNTGDASVTHVRLTDDLPRGITNAEDFDEDLGTIGEDDEEVVTFEARVDADSVSSGTCIVNTAETRGDNVSRVEDSASVCVTKVLSENINLNFSKKAWNNTRNADAQSVTANRGDLVTYTLTVNNSGNAKANDFVITDDLSGVLPFVDIVDIDGATLNGNVITFPPVNIAAGGSVQKTFQVRVKNSLQQNLTFVLRNTYGNTVTVNVGSVQGVATFVAPKTGAAGTSAAVFAGLITAGFLGFRKRRELKKLIFT
jgi:uncharacterized repeat protein (TIGR01451 family)/fimbrial isopeptide formation D2 family protein/LPXTG-motif cell wall-anchored protein